VAEGQHLRDGTLGVPEGSEVRTFPVLVVDDDRVLATPAELAGTVVAPRVVGQELGPKIRGFTYQAQGATPASVGAPPAVRHRRDLSITVPAGR